MCVYLKINFEMQPFKDDIGLHPGPTLGGAGPNWEQFRSAQVPSLHALRSVELGAGPNWDLYIITGIGRISQVYICVGGQAHLCGCIKYFV